MDRQTDAPPSRKPGSIVAALGVHFVLCVLVLLLYVVVVPKLAAGFASMNVELPAPTALVIKLSGALTRHWPLLPVLVVGFLAADGVGLVLLSQGARRRNALRAWSAIVTIGLACLFGLTIISVFIPFRLAIQQLTQ